MNKKILCFSMALILCLCLSSCTKKSECEKNGHTWQDATYVAPKTCSVCGETEGEALQETFATLEAALEEINTSSSTALVTQTTKVGEETNVLTVKMEVNGNYTLNTMTMSNETVYSFTEVLGTKIYQYMKQSESSSWMYVGETNVDDYVDTNTVPTDAEFTEDMFTLTNGIWVGDLTKINTLFAPYFELLNQMYEGTGISVSSIMFNKYDVELNNGKVENVWIDMAFTMSVSGTTLTTVSSTHMAYSKIGSTIVTKPADLPAAE